VAHHEQRTPIGVEGINQLVNALQVEVVGRLVEQQQLGWGLGEQDAGERHPESLAARQPPGRLVDPTATNEEPGKLCPQHIRGGRRSGTAQVLEHAGVIVQDVEALRKVPDTVDPEQHALARRTMDDLS
jgi:hypothetical protein